MKTILFCLSLWLIGTAPTAFAQQTDLRLWTGIGLEKKLIPKLSARVTVQTRFADPISTVGSYIGELGLSYKLNRHWQVAGFYRYISKRSWQDDDYRYVMEARHRFYADLSYDRKLGRRLKIDNRLRYQNQFADDTREQRNRSFLRNKVEVSGPNPGRFTPFGSADVFYALGEGFDRIRYRIGTDYKLSKGQAITVFGFTDQELMGRIGPDLTLGITYKITF